MQVAPFSSSIFQFSGHPYVLAGVVSTFIYFLVLLYLNKKNLKSSAMSALIFALWFSVGWFSWDYISKMVGSNTNIDNSINRYTVGLYGTVAWFLFSLLVQKRPLYRAMTSAGIFLIFYIVAEIIYTLLTNMQTTL